MVFSGKWQNNGPAARANKKSAYLLPNSYNDVEGRHNKEFL